MKEFFNVGDIVYSKSHKVKGKVVKVKPHERLLLAEVILSFDRETGIRTTKLMKFALSDVRLYKFDKKNVKETVNVEQAEPVNETETVNKEEPKINPTLAEGIDLFKNFSDETREELGRLIKESMEKNGLPKISMPKVNIPNGYK